MPTCLAIPFFEDRKERTSKDAFNYHGRIRQIPEGMVELTATVIWTTMMTLGFPPESFVGWNSFAWHPHLSNDRLSDRTPTIAEIEQGQPVLRAFLDLFPGRNVIAIGNTCKRTLERMGIKAASVRHPAYSGASQFRNQMAAIAEQLRS